MVEQSTSPRPSAERRPRNHFAAPTPQNAERETRSQRLDESRRPLLAFQIKDSIETHWADAKRI